MLRAKSHRRSAAPARKANRSASAPPCFLPGSFLEGIYFPQLTKRQWAGLLWSNRVSLIRILKEAYQAYRGIRRDRFAFGRRAGSGHRRGRAAPRPPDPNRCRPPLYQGVRLG